jgi:hypothetical protein
MLTAPQLPSGVTYTSFATGRIHSAAVRSDGVGVAFGSNAYGQCDVPPLAAGLSYAAVAVGNLHTLLLRSDGTIAAFGSNWLGQCNVPTLPVGLRYVSVAAGYSDSFAQRSDGALVHWGGIAPLMVAPHLLGPDVRVTGLSVGTLTALVRLQRNVTSRICSPATPNSTGSGASTRTSQASATVRARCVSVARSVVSSARARSRAQEQRGRSPCASTSLPYRHRWARSRRAWARPGRSRRGTGTRILRPTRTSPTPSQ